MSEVRLDIGIEPDAEAADLEQAALQLRDELLQIDVDSVERPPGEAPPPGARAAEAALAGTLIVFAGQEAIRSVIRTIEAWVTRRKTSTVKVTLAGDSIELTNLSEADRERLIESFLARHAPASS